jgi:hypothetical protein
MTERINDLLIRIRLGFSSDAPSQAGAFLISDVPIVVQNYDLK